jgi:hypothetical protein
MDDSVKNEKPIPKQIQELWLDYQAAIELRDAYTKRPFGFKKALKCTKISISKRNEFWNLLRDLYPELGPTISINLERWTVFEKEK